MFSWNVESKAFGTHRKVIDRNITVDSQSHARLNLHKVLRCDVRQEDFNSDPLIAVILRRPPERRCDVLAASLDLNHRDIDASSIQSKLMNVKSRIATAEEWRSCIRVTRWRWIKNNRVDHCNASEASVGTLLRIVCMLIHIDEKEIASLVGVLKGVIELGTSLVCRRWTVVTRPAEQRLARVLPAAPVGLEVAHATVWDFV